MPRLPRQADKLIQAIFLIFTTTILGCNMNQDKRNYRLNEVQARVISEASAPTPNTYMVFSTLLETQFYSPGINVRRDKVSTRIEFIRAGIRDKTPSIDLKAEYLTQWIKDKNLSAELREKLLHQSTSAEQIIVLPGEVGNLYITDGESEKKIWPMQ